MSVKRMSTRRALVSAVAGLAVAAWWFSASVVRAETFGQITAWGGPGTAADELNSPTLLGVDPSDNSVYVIDVSADFGSYRLQKFSSNGTAVASVTIGRPIDVNSQQPLLDGIAVDPATHRIYLLQSQVDAAGTLAADQIDVFSTQESGGTLVAPSDLPSGTLPVPDRGAPSTALVSPRGITVDPTTHDLVVAAYNAPDLATIVVQRISSSGLAGTRYTDGGATGSTALAGASYGNLSGVTVGTDGSTYLTKGTFQQLASVYILPPTLASVATFVDGLSSVASAEAWRGYGGSTSNAFLGGLGPQLAVSPDGQTLYWAERVNGDNDTTPGNYTLRGFSLASGATSVLYGGFRAGVADHTAGICEITHRGAALAPGSNGVVYVLDHGNYDSSPPTYGARVVEFGPGGSGCPAPVASFAVNGSGQDEVTVQKGATVHFDASGSALNGAAPSELDWDLDGSGQFATQVTGSPADETLDHQFLQKGDFAVGLKMQLTGGSFGNPPLVTKTVHVVPGTPTASFSASTHAPVAGGSVHFDAGQSVDPTGSPTAGPTHTLKTYHWSFGDGAQQDTMTATVDHTFANGSTSAVNRTVALTVTSTDDVTSGSVSQQVAVQGQPAVVTPPPSTTATPPPAPLPPAPGKVSLTGAKLAGTGAAAFTLGCAAVPGPCAGSLTLTAIIAVKAKGKGAKAKSKRVTVGSASFSLAAGQHGKVLSIRLSSAAKALLRLAHKLKVTVSIKTRNSVGATSSASKTVTLVAPKPKRRKH